MDPKAYIWQKGTLEGPVVPADFSLYTAVTDRPVVVALMGRTEGVQRRLVDSGGVFSWAETCAAKDAPISISGLDCCAELIICLPFAAR